MDNLLKTAIVGTAQVAGNIELTTGTQVDMLSRQLPSGERERNILLAAGSLEIYHLAGQRTQKRADQLEQAQPEQLPLCSEQAALLLETLLVWQYQPLLPEALERLQASQRRVPYRLLPRLLQYGSKHKAPRTALLAAMGERGHWLAQQNPEWKWALQHRVDENSAACRRRRPDRNHMLLRNAGGHNHNRRNAESKSRGKECQRGHGRQTHVIKIGVH